MGGMGAGRWRHLVPGNDLGTSLERGQHVAFTATRHVPACTQRHLQLTCHTCSGFSAFRVGSDGSVSAFTGRHLSALAPTTGQSAWEEKLPCILSPSGHSRLCLST